MKFETKTQTTREPRGRRHYDTDFTVPPSAPLHLIAPDDIGAPASITPTSTHSWAARDHIMTAAVVQLGQNDRIEQRSTF